jgi:hypothetical protein
MRPPALVRSFAPACLAILASTGLALPQASDHPTRPIEALILVGDAAPRCQPQELRLPAEANVDLRIQNGGGKAIVVRAPELFAQDRVRSSTGATADGSGGFRVEGSANAQMLLKTPPRASTATSAPTPAGAAAA